jgi:hypothetical protein
MDLKVKKGCESVKCPLISIAVFDSPIPSHTWLTVIEQVLFEHPSHTPWTSQSIEDSGIHDVTLDSGIRAFFDIESMPAYQSHGPA